MKTSIHDLTPDAKTAMLAAYYAGQKLREIAGQFGCRLALVNTVIEREGVGRRKDVGRIVPNPAARASTIQDPPHGWDDPKVVSWCSAEEARQALAWQRGRTWQTHLMS